VEHLIDFGGIDGNIEIIVSLLGYGELQLVLPHDGGVFFGDIVEKLVDRGLMKV